MKLLSRIALALSATCLSFAAAAQAFPNQPLRWVVPYPAGGGTDVAARTIANEMQQAIGQPIPVDNRPGANTIVGADFIAKARADGYTIGSADNATLALNQGLYAKLPYNPATDFSIVGGIARFPYVLVVGPKSSAKTLEEFLAAARKAPGTITYGSPGLGGPNHVAMELLQQRTSLKFNHVPYRGAAPGIQDLLAGTIDCMLVDTGSSMPHIKSGKLRALAVAYDNRLAPLPDVPTFAEAGVKDFSAFSWQFLVAPAGTPRAAMDKLGDALAKALARDDVRKRLGDLGIEPSPMPAAEATRFVAAEAERWGSVIRTAN
ncbi:MAG: tripartite tricarboxylate transporter substrate binding protein, partial [Comamonadaceae bacterium]